MPFKPVIGLEIHVELKTKSKMFCSCANDPFQVTPNVHICPICLGHPGTLPVINEEAVRKTIKTGLALNCQILEYSKFDRKNYFYPDLPKGYQISQYEQPLCQGGFLEIVNPQTQKPKIIRIRRVHLEEDTGKLLHPAGKDYSLVDFNRAGIPLLELVTEPDINSPQEARQFAQELQLILRYLNVSDADMEKGQMRIEANISLTKKGKGREKSLGPKVEIKNLNSFVALEKALESEIERQGKLLKEGKKITQETRGWDPVSSKTFSQREKEEAYEYRYFPEPDLPPLHITKQLIKEIQAEISELPQERRSRFKKEYNLLPNQIEILVQEKNWSDYFEKIVSELQEWILSLEKKRKIAKKEKEGGIQLLANYLLTDFKGLLAKKELLQKDLEQIVSPENFAEFISLIYEGAISSKIAKTILEEMVNTGKDPSEIIKERNLNLIVDPKKIEAFASQVIQENPKGVADFKKGKERAVEFLLGQIMAKSKGQVEPNLAREVLTRLLKNLK